MVNESMIQNWDVKIGLYVFFFNDTATTEIYTLSLHDALPISMGFDALGLPAENAAIKAGENPKPFTERAIKNYIRQMKEIGRAHV